MNRRQEPALPRRGVRRHRRDRRTRRAVPVHVALMIEGQEGVSWQQWCALADACEQHGVHDALPLRPLHLAVGRDRQRRARRLDDARRPRRTHDDAPLRHARLARHLPPAGPARERRRDRRPHLRRPHRARDRRRLDGARAPRVRLPVPGDARRGSRCSPSSSRSCTGSGRDERVDFHGAHYTLEDAPAQPKPRAAAAPAAPRRRQRHARHRRACCALRRRVQHAVRLTGGLRAHPRQGAAGVRGDRPHAALLDDDRLPDRRDPRRRTRSRATALRARPARAELRRLARRLLRARASSARSTRSPSACASTSEPAASASCSSTCCTPTSSRCA